jgi:hypothetical protein
VSGLGVLILLFIVGSTIWVGVDHRGLDRDYGCEPRVNQCRAGWLASSPTSHPFRIGVVGDDREDAVRKFEAALAAWNELSQRAAQESRATG